MSESDFHGATIVTAPWTVPGETDTAESAYRKVIDSAGCSMHRDKVDAQLIEEVKSLGKLGAMV